MLWFWRLWHILFHESPRGHRCRGVTEVTVHKSAKNDDEIALWQEGICATIIRERDDLRAEVEEMRGECKAHGIELTETRAEIDRLRALFRHIVDNEPEGDVPPWIGKVARRGLMG